MICGYRIQWLTAFVLVFSSHFLLGQRVYTGNSVLATGNWYKIAVKAPGIYKIDISLLQSLNINTPGLNPVFIRVFGNGGLVLPENTTGFRIDDLPENPILVEDGGDGILNGNDYILFYAQGPDSWTNDSINQRFSHQKNIYSDHSYYYMNIGGNVPGKRITTTTAIINPNATITSFNARYFYELDSINFLSSGKQWVGEEFSNAPGKTLSRSFPVPMPGITGAPATIIVSCLARSINSPSRFNIKVNNQQLKQVDVPPVGSGIYDQYARVENTVASFTSSSADLSVGFDYSPGSFNSQGWLDWFEIFTTRDLSMSGTNQLLFRNWASVKPGNRGNFIIRNAGNSTQVWDITQPLEPRKMPAVLTGSDLSFVNDCSSLHEYISFNNTGFLTPVAIGKVENQNLHNTTAVDLLIVTHSSLLGQAQRLSQYHIQRDQLTTLVVTTEQIFNEFSSGTPDPSAIRDFVKMFYDRAGVDTAKRPKYLLLFGHGSFDYKKRISDNVNLVPVYESDISLDPLATYTSDDFFGFLDDGDDIRGTGTYLLDIGIGRIPAANEAQARSIVDKIIAYTGTAAFGPWRNELSFVADDEDNNLHLQDAEIITGTVASEAPVFNSDKIYLDAFRQQSSSSGSRYPDVNLAISNKLFNGTLIWNYNGHGGFRRLAEEVVLDQDIINTFNNPDKLPLFITATCDFAPHDNPQIKSIGEDLLLRDRTGSIALMTTTRLVFAFSNRIMNKNYFEAALKRKNNGSYPTLGEAVKNAKNTTYQFFGDVVNNRKFTLLGDPALTIAYPVQQVRTEAINGKAVSSIPDTLKALTRYTIAGAITDHLGNILTDFNGTVYPSVFDKVQSVNTLANDAGSFKTSFEVQDNTIFKGKATVKNGKFSFDFIVPADINYQFGNGKISFYATDGKTDGNGSFTNFIVGSSALGSTDTKGPEINAYLNDENFVEGATTTREPILLLRLADTSGINIMGTGIGHDLVATLDDDPQKKFVLNGFYEGELDSYKKGTVRFQMQALTEGLHTLTIKAWDIVNNSSETRISFKVPKQPGFNITGIFNYPNPFTRGTTFRFEHNGAPGEIKVSIEIFTLLGTPVKTIRSTIISSANRSNEVPWDGNDETGRITARGVYIYRLRIQTTDGNSAQKVGKAYRIP